MRLESAAAASAPWATRPKGLRSRGEWKHGRRVVPRSSKLTGLQSGESDRRFRQKDKFTSVLFPAPHTTPPSEASCRE